MRREKTSVKKKIGIIFSVFTAFVLILCFSGYLIVGSYLNKIHYVSSTTQLVSDIDEDSMEDGAVSDSPQQEIDAISQNIQNNIHNYSTPPVYNKDIFNVLLIGSDNRIAGTSGRSDSMILLSINKKTSEIVATSLLRDIYLQIPGITQGNRLNAAYAFGGADLLLKTIRENFKISVDKYIAVDFYSFMDIIDKVGGVTIDISNDELRVANDYIREINGLKDLPYDDGLISNAGEQTLNGKQALGYARIRYIGNADFGRTDRQRQVLEQLFEKMKKLSLNQLNDLLNTFLPEVTTNLGKGELFSLLLSLPTYEKYTLVSWRVPVDGSFSYVTVHKMSVLNINFAENIAEMQKRIYG